MLITLAVAGVEVEAFPRLTYIFSSEVSLELRNSHASKRSILSFISELSSGFESKRAPREVEELISDLKEIFRMLVTNFSCSTMLT